MERARVGMLCFGLVKWFYRFAPTRNESDNCTHRRAQAPHTDARNDTSRRRELGHSHGQQHATTSTAKASVVQLSSALSHLEPLGSQAHLVSLDKVATGVLAFLHDALVAERARVRTGAADAAARLLFVL